MKECVLYKKVKSGIKCLACNHKCFIPENHVGICGVRKNIDNKLYLLVYGKVIAKHVDPIEKKPLFHFLPKSLSYSVGTIGCNFKCGFCQNYQISQLKLGNYEIMTPEQIVKEALKNNCKSISYTYNEPTIFIEFCKDIMVLAKKAGLKNIFVSNGYMSKEAIDFISPYLDAINIDLKSFSSRFYNKICKAKLDPVLNNIREFYKKGIHIEITTLIIPGENDSVQNIKKIAKFISSVDPNIPWHISRFFPMFKMLDKEPTSLFTLQKAYQIGKKYLKYVYVGNV